jgi:hypothetical protein
LKLLGPDDEPQDSGAVVAVHWGDYRRQEVWVSSGANIGNWYCLGGEFRVGGPPSVDDPRPYAEKMISREYWTQPPGTVPVQPVWDDVLKRGPVVLLTPGDEAVHTAGWVAGRRRLLEQIETLRDDEDVPPGTGIVGGISEATQRYADNMRAAGLDVVVTEVASGQVRVSGRVQALEQFGAELVCTGDEGDHDGRATMVVFTTSDGAEADRSGPHCRRHATERAGSWNAALGVSRGWTAAVVEDEDEPA